MSATLRHPEWFPDFYTAPVYPNVEEVLDTFWKRLLGGGVTVIRYIKEEHIKRLQDGESFLRFARTSGHINGDQLRDQARVQTAALTPSRDDSHELIGFVRDMYETANHGGIYVDGALIRETGEVVGPQLIPEQIRESRLVPVTHDIYIGASNKELADAYPKALRDYLA